MNISLVHLSPLRAFGGSTEPANVLQLTKHVTAKDSIEKWCAPKGSI